LILLRIRVVVTDRIRKFVLYTEKNDSMTVPEINPILNLIF